MPTHVIAYRSIIDSTRSRVLVGARSGKTLQPGTTSQYECCNKRFCEEFIESRFVLPEGGPLQELSFCAGGSNRKVTVTADTRRHGECDGGPSRLK